LSTSGADSISAGMVILQQSDDFPKLVDLNFGKDCALFVLRGIATLILSV
jgi:hypothetical protein